ncbi:hypothetical protein K8354_15965 [Polaribacter litorisediminis]|uniref:hypothetical protein n=1 Tax=Polaribacter litorisediminis TaxID=1908341 RepID=UPI001CC178C1|nr:hypothetical protein [Polaribacter litorisediminis]UAM97770.1 hypothetical protein K8354_15965 [Polaribacter litorisediminis]
MKSKYSLEKLDSFLTNYPIILEIYSKKEVLRLYENWHTNNGVFFHDYLWLLFNKAILKNGDIFQASNDESLFYQNAFFLYNCMAHFRREEGGSIEEINKFHRLSHKVYIEEAKNDKIGIKQEIALIPHPRCEYANSLSKKRYSINNFFDECKIASEVCTLNSGCGCSITKVAKRDKNGDLIRELNTKKTNEFKEPKGCAFSLLSIIISFTVLIYSILY